MLSSLSHVKKQKDTIVEKELAANNTTYKLQNEFYKICFKESTSENSNELIMCAQQENQDRLNFSTQEQEHSASSACSVAANLPEVFAIDGPEENYPSLKLTMYQANGGALSYNLTGYLLYSSNSLIQNQLLQEITRRERSSLPVLGLKENENKTEVSYTPGITFGEGQELSIEIPKETKYGKISFSRQQHGQGYFNHESIESPNCQLQKTSIGKWPSTCERMNLPSFKFTMRSRENLKELPFIIVIKTYNKRRVVIARQKIGYNILFINKENLDKPLTDGCTHDQKTLVKHWETLLNKMQRVDLVVEQLARYEMLDRNNEINNSAQPVERQNVGQLLSILYQKQLFLVQFKEALRNTNDAENIDLANTLL